MASLFYDFPAANAGSAYVNALSASLGTANQNFDFLQIGFPHLAALVIGMAHFMAILNAFSTNFTYGSHESPILKRGYGIFIAGTPNE
jgi:hypothetical protein